MFCSSCGKENAAGAAFCGYCGSKLATVDPQAPANPALPGPTVNAPPPAGPLPTIPNYLVQAILTTFFCCLPFGVVSIIYASQVTSKLERGDVAGAQQASRSARTWAWVAFGVGLAGGLLYLVFAVILGAVAHG